MAKCLLTSYESLRGRLQTVIKVCGYVCGNVCGYVCGYVWLCVVMCACVWLCGCVCLGGCVCSSLCVCVCGVKRLDCQVACSIHPLPLWLTTCCFVTLAQHRIEQTAAVMPAFSPHMVQSLMNDSSATIIRRVCFGCILPPKVPRCFAVKARGFVVWAVWPVGARGRGSGERKRPSRFSLPRSHVHCFCLRCAVCRYCRSWRTLSAVAFCDTATRYHGALTTTGPQTAQPHSTTNLSASSSSA